MDSAPTQSERNVELAMPMARLRAVIAERWIQISDLLRDLNISEKPHLTQKILASEAMSDHIRMEVRRILECEPAESAKADDLRSLLTKTEADVDAIQAQRNALQSENGGIVGGFFKHPKFKNFYAERLDFETRRNLAEAALLRAADTFDPSMGELTTYAFWWIQSTIREAADKDAKHTRVSLDKESRGDTTNFLALTEDRRAEQPYEIEHRRELREMLHNVMKEMPLHLRRALELTQGLCPDHRVHSPEDAAEIMMHEGVETTEKKVGITKHKVCSWVSEAKRVIAQKMQHLFVENEGNT